MKRHLRIALKVSAALSLVSTITWVAANASAARELEAAVTRARAAGVPLSSVEIEVADASDHENATLLYLEAVERFALVEREGGFDGRLVESDGVLHVTEELKRALPAYREVFDLLRRATELPHCTFPSPSDRRCDSRIRLASVLRIADVLAANAITLVESGAVAEAAQDLRALGALGEAVATHSAISNQLVRFALLRRATDVARLVLAESDSAIGELDTFGLTLPRESLSVGIAGEMAMLGQIFGEDGTNKVPVGPYLIGCSGPSAPAWLGDVTFFLVKPYWQKSLAEIIDYNRECAVAGRLPYPEGLARIRKLVSALDEDWNPVKRQLCTKHAGLLDREARIAARIELLRLGALFLDHRRSTGSYPEVLGDLDGPLPLDPTTGSPFLLERDGGCVTLRSGYDDKVSWRLPS